MLGRCLDGRPHAARDSYLRVLHLRARHNVGQSDDFIAATVVASGLAHVRASQPATRIDGGQKLRALQVVDCPVVLVVEAVQRCGEITATG